MIGYSMDDIWNKWQNCSQSITMTYLSPAQKTSPSILVLCIHLSRLCETSLTGKYGDMDGSLHMTRSVGLARSQEPLFSDDLMVSEQMGGHGNAQNMLHSVKVTEVQSKFNSAEKQMKSINNLNIYSQINSTTPTLPLKRLIMQKAVKGYTCNLTDVTVNHARNKYLTLHSLTHCYLEKSSPSHRTSTKAAFTPLELNPSQLCWLLAEICAPFNYLLSSKINSVEVYTRCICFQP